MGACESTWSLLWWLLVCTLANYSVLVDCMNRGPPLSILSINFISSQNCFFPKKTPIFLPTFFLDSQLSLYENLSEPGVCISKSDLQLFSCHRGIATGSTFLVHTCTANTGDWQPALHWKHNSKNLFSLTNEKYMYTVKTVLSLVFISVTVTYTFTGPHSSILISFKSL